MKTFTFFSFLKNQSILNTITNYFFMKRTQSKIINIAKNKFKKILKKNKKNFKNLILENK